MPHRSEKMAMPASREAVSLLAVDRAVSDLRRGRMVVVSAAGGESALVLAAEGVTPDAMAAMAEAAGTAPRLALTARRAAVLGLSEAQSPVVELVAGPDVLAAQRISELADPLTGNAEATRGVTLMEASAHGCPAAAVGLAKIARLLPAALVAPLNDPAADDVAAWALRHDFLWVDAGDVFQYEHTAARSLKAVSEATVPLDGAEETRIVAFRPRDGGLEHLAILIGNPTEPVLTRLHSECFTGDLLGSLRCDCGDQLRGAIREIAKAGGGVLLYLAQEGRGIGLVNKLRAYSLQDQGFDTLDANEELGFDADERIYLPAARMLRLLGFTRVKLLTNNPDKVAALSEAGVTVEERVAHAFPSNKHNEGYLATKATRGGHLF